MSTWDETRIAELRRLAERAEETRKVSVCSIREWQQATDDLHDALSPEAVLSLLDELEGVRERAEDYKDAFDEVMLALAVALDDDADYNALPAELVWKLRNQRDEALQTVSDLRAEWLK